MSNWDYLQTDNIRGKALNFVKDAKVSERVGHFVIESVLE
jgi:hypothetical protein